MAFFQKPVNFYAFVCPFSRGAFIVKHLPLRRTPWRIAEKSWIIFQAYVYNTSIIGLGTRIEAHTESCSIFCHGTNILGSVPFLISTVRPHRESQWTNWYTIRADGIPFVFWSFDATRIQVNEGSYVVFFTHCVDGTCIVCGIED